MSTIAVTPGITPTLGQLITFDCDVTEHVKRPRVEVKAYQDGGLVYGETLSADQEVQQELTGLPGVILGGAPPVDVPDDGDPTTPTHFPGGSVWANTGGPAECVANLFHFAQVKGVQTYMLLAQVQFHAEG